MQSWVSSLAELDINIEYLCNCLHTMVMLQHVNDEIEIMRIDSLKIIIVNANRKSIN